MLVSPLNALPPMKRAQSAQAPVTPVRFGFAGGVASAAKAGGAIGLISWGVDLLQNRSIELAVTDFMGMCVPRSYVEYKNRGWDSARENVIRELTAMFFNVFISGWTGALVWKVLADKKGSLNPQAVNHRAWVDAGVTDYWGKLYKDVVTRPSVKTPKQAEEVFIQEALKRLQSVDKVAGRRMMEQALLVSARNDQALREKVLKNIPENGHLHDETLKTLVSHYSGKPEGVLGSLNLMGDAAERVKLQRKHTELDPKQILVERWRLSKGLQQRDEQPFVHIVDESAKMGGLSQNVHLLDELGKPVFVDRNRTTTLRQLRYFMMEVMDRATHDKNGKLLSGNEWKEKTLEALYRPRPNGFGAKILPHAEQGLIDYLTRSKNVLTWFPLLATIVTSMSVAFINNRITQKRHGGRSFSPVEEGLKVKGHPGEPRPAFAGGTVV